MKSAWRRAWMGLLHTLYWRVLLAAGGGMLLGLWWWLGSATSLATALALLPGWLPAGYQLEARAVSGSLRSGGRLGYVRWHSPGLTVEADDLQLAWDVDVARLWRAQWALQTVRAAAVRVQPTGDVPATPPPTALQLPLALDIPFALEHITWLGPVPLSARGVQGHYRYAADQHSLDIDQLLLAQGRYRGQARLQALAPLALQARVEGEVSATVPAGGQALMLSAHATLTGTLAGPTAELALAAALQPASVALSTQPTRLPDTMQARLQARLQPWATQPVVQAESVVQALDLAALWPHAPHTALHGTLRAGPSAQGWQLQAALHNRQPGPWHRQRLPVTDVQAAARYAAGVWHISSAQVQVGRGQIRLDGRYDPRQRALVGQAALTVPGGQLRLIGEIGPRSGAGELGVAVSAAAALQSWLQTVLAWPAAQDVGLALQGSVQWHSRWQGGWLGLRQQLQALGWPPAGTDAPSGQVAFNVESSVSIADVRVAQGRLRQLRLTASGPLLPRSATLHAQAQWGRYPVEVVAQLAADAPPQGAAPWQARIQQLRVQLQNPQQPSAAWLLDLQQPWAWSVQAPAAPAGGLVLQADAGQARLSGPLAGSVQLQWADQRLERSAAGRWQGHSQGQITGLPLTWLAAWAPAAAVVGAEAIAGNVVLAADWQVQAHAQWRTQLRVQRSSGDVRLSALPEGSAGLRQAQITLRMDDAQLQADAVWDSERAGQIQAHASSRLQRGADGWHWPEDAPLAGQVQARLPELGVWAALAPPGWRTSGSLQADVTLAGSRASPHWQGSLSAEQLALRSLVDGVDLQQGRLRAVLHGQQLDITELTLHGGPASQARILGYSGNLTPAPQDGGLLRAQGRVVWGTGAGAEDGPSVDLRAQAQALQVLVRADRQVSVSGTLQARWQAGQALRLRGALRTDRATLRLPEEATPHLGSDVVVRSSHPSASATAPASTPAPRRAMLQPDIAITLDLGDDFALQGHGITTRLAGTLEIGHGQRAGAPPRIHGEVRTVQGRYRAWGQQLEVETGLLRFNGPHDNPALDILALRPQISVRAGVQISGTAQAPRVRLYAEPDLPDAEKLSWLVLGRETASGGAQTLLLQQAALALWGGQASSTPSGMVQRLGLDEIGFRGADTGQVSSAAITLGKRLSRDLYVTYEHSLAGAVGVISVFYDLSRQLTLRGQTGRQTALDMLYTVRHD